MEFANDYLANGGSIDTVKSKIYDSTTFPASAPVQKDLLFVASNWTSSSFDLWEVRILSSRAPPTHLSIENYIWAAAFAVRVLIKRGEKELSKPSSFSCYSKIEAALFSCGRHFWSETDADGSIFLLGGVKRPLLHAHGPAACACNGSRFRHQDG